MRVGRPARGVPPLGPVLEVKMKGGRFLVELALSLTLAWVAAVWGFYKTCDNDLSCSMDPALLFFLGVVFVGLFGAGVVGVFVEWLVDRKKGPPR
jgi:hypothetical protein